MRKIRTLGLLVLLVLLAGGGWLFLRETAPTKILRWRDASRFFLETGEIDRAEELNEKILGLVPDSAFDLLYKARLEERRGTPERLAKALEIYDDVLRLGGHKAVSVTLHKARLYRKLGRFTRAQAAALSVMDTLPFEATSELGAIGMATFDPYEALAHHQRALKEFAATDLQRAWALEAIADAYLLRLDLGGPRKGAMEVEPDRRKTAELLAEKVEARVRKALDESVELLMATPVDQRSEEVLVWIGRLCEKRSRVREPGEAPCRDGAAFLLERIEEGRRAAREPTAPLSLAVGRLLLTAADSELQDMPGTQRTSRQELLDKARRHFLAALGDRTAEDARQLLQSAAGRDDSDLEPDPEAKTRHEYARQLVSVCMAFLASSEFERLLADPSKLSLPQLIREAIESPDGDLSRVFRLVSGLALLRAGRSDEAERVLDAYVASYPVEERPAAAVALADQCLQTGGDGKFLLRLLDRFEASGGRPVDLLSKRVSLLVKATGRLPLTAEGVSEKIESMLQAAARDAGSPADHLAVAKIRLNLKGRRAAIASLRAAREQFPSDAAIRLTLGNLLIEEGKAAVRDADAKAASSLSLYREALEEHLAVFLAEPALDVMVFQRAVALLETLESEQPGAPLSPLVEELFPKAHAEALASFAESLRAFLRAEYARAVKLADQVSHPEAFQPFLSFLKGTCHTQLALVQASATTATQDAKTTHLRLAREAFAVAPGYLPNRLELLNLELAAVNEKRDVPDDLLARIDAVTRAEELQHQGHWLLARALRHRLRHRLDQASGTNEEITTVLRRMQVALRSAIERQPFLTPAYVALADSFVLGARQAQGQSPRGPSELPAAEYRKAINLLKAVPRPNEVVLETLTSYFEALSDFEEAQTHLEALVLLSPTERRFWRLADGYLRIDAHRPLQRILLDEFTREPALPEGEQRLRDVLLEGIADRGERDGWTPRTALALVKRGKEGPETLSRALSTSLRGRLEELPGYEAIRHVVLGRLYADQLATALGDAAREVTRHRMLTHYGKALQLYEAKGGEAPLILLNNFAWQLAQHPDPARRKEGLKLAQRAKDAVSNPAQLPSVQDTLAWALHRNGRTTEAEREYRELLSRVDSPAFRYRFAEVLFALGRYDKALTHIDRALQSPHQLREVEAARDLWRRIRRVYQERVTSS